MLKFVKFYFVKRKLTDKIIRPESNNFIIGSCSPLSTSFLGLQQSSDAGLVAPHPNNNILIKHIDRIFFFIFILSFPR